VCTLDDFDGQVGDERGGASASEVGRRDAAPLRSVLEHLLAMQSDLAGDVMPRAARITGTSHLLRQVSVRLDAAIGTTRALLEQQQHEVASVSPAASGPSNAAAWSAEQECIAAMRAARSVV
jgi:hypothetical protein